MKWLFPVLLMLVPPPDIFALREMLGAKEPSVRAAAVRELSRRTGTAKLAQKELLAVALGDRGLLRERAIQVLRATGFDFEKTLAEEVRPGLADGSAAKREEAARFLALVGPPEALAFEARMKKLLDDGAEHVRAAAAAALLRLDREKERALAVLAGAATSTDPAVRAHAARGYGWTAGKTKTSLDALGPLLSDPDPGVRLAAARAHGDLGERARHAVARLRKAMRDGDPGVRAQAAESLGKLSRHAKPAVKDLFARLADENEEVRYRAAVALSELAEVSFPLLLDRLTDEKKPALRRHALRALAFFGSSAKPAVPEIAKLLESDDRDLVIEAITTLAMLRATAREALPEIRLLAFSARDRKVKQAAEVARKMIEAEVD